MSNRRMLSPKWFLGLLPLLALPLSAQLNPKWQTINSPDFLNLYQQSNSTTIKPEVVTVFDFTGSMARGMYHANFNNLDYNDGDSGSNLRLTLTRGGTSPNYTYTCVGSMSVAAGRYPYGTGTSYTAFNLTNGTLIRPDGTTVTEALINANYVASTPALPGETASPLASDVRNWMRSASHVRFTYNSRTLDLPIAWTILDDFSVVRNVAAGEYRQMYNTYPLKMTILDPVSNTEVEMDACYRVPGSTRPIGTPNTNWPTQTLDYVCSYGAFYARSYMHWMWRSSPQPIPNVDGTHYAFHVFDTNGKRIDVPGRSRSQAVKDAALRVWVKYYNKVFWAYRFVHNTGANLEGGRGNNLSSDTGATFPADPRTTANTVGGGQRGWRLMNGNSLAAMQQLAAYTDENGTPLNMALGNTLAQYNDPDSVFNAVEVAPNDEPQECMKHFVILFTDGQPNGEGTGRETSVASPYINAGVGSVNMGNAVFVGDKTLINPSNASGYFNIVNLAALAAHGGDSSQPNFLPAPAYPGAGTYTGGSTTANNWIPFWIKGRSTTSFGTAHPIQTMTVGVSLAGDYTSTTGSKYRMFAAAALGDPNMKTWNLNAGGLKPFALTDPNDPNSPKDPNSVYFFDANDPNSLVTYLEKAFEASTAIANTNSTATPVLPTMGSGLGQAVYLTKFEPPSQGGPVWKGDLLMYPIREDSNGVSRLLDASGTALIGSDLADPDKARWAASKILTSKLWFNRTIYTRLVASGGTPQPNMLKVTVGSTSTAATISDPGYLAIKALLPGSSDAAKFDNWLYYIGADPGSALTPKPTRANIMGDVVNSAPAVLDFTSLPSTITSTALTTAWSVHASHNRQFRIIFVGTNQGFLHAFGEVSWDETVAGKKQQNGVADELWAFAPTDLLPYVNYYRNSGNAHRFAVDGSPTIYLLDLPPSNAVRGNGAFNVGSTKERAMVIFGLGKGGRSYYAIDVRDPVNPVFQENNSYGEGMGWSLCPDEPFNYPAARFQTPASASSAPTIINMGLSTASPSLGRMLATGSKVVKDLVFLGGGYSVPEIEANLPVAPAAPPNRNTLLGRSVVVLDARRGNILGVWDLSGTAGVGPVSAGVVPFKVFRSAAYNQRAYFADFFGGVWALGYGGRYPSASITNGDFRIDSSYLDDWSSTARPVYRQPATDGFISSMPVPFLSPRMPVRTSSPTVSPAAVGVAFVTGDRNNPLDLYYSAGWTKPVQHRVNVVFDRVDSYSLGLDSNGITPAQLANAQSMTTSERNPTDSSFYLKSKYGYYINFAKTPVTSAFVPKGMFSPLLLGGRLFYSYFMPSSANPCTGGSGETHTFRECNVMLPTGIVTDAADTTACDSGRVLKWTGVASPFAVRSLVTGLQAGMSGGTGTNNNPNAPQNMQMQNLTTESSDIFPKPRVWRTVH